jgi:GNAT superfamily N-acetyltransferase
MEIEISKTISNSDQSKIYHIWNVVYPTQVAFIKKNDFEAYLEKAGYKTHYIIRGNNYSVSGWLMTFNRDDERYFVLLVNENMQGNGIGTALINEMKKIENKIAGWIVESDSYFKSDGSLYHSPMSFYKNLGFTMTNEINNKNDFSTTKIIWKRI